MLIRSTSDFTRIDSNAGHIAISSSQSAVDLGFSASDRAPPTGTGPLELHTNRFQFRIDLFESAWGVFQPMRRGKRFVGERRPARGGTKWARVDFFGLFC